MTLIGILLALAVERLLGQLPGWGKPVLFLSGMRTVRALLPPVIWASPALPLLVVALPTALVWWGLPQVDSLLVQLVLSAVLLLLCLGPRDLAEEVRALLQARAAGDTQRADQLARALQRGPDPGDTHASLAGALFIQSHEKLFGVLIWYFVCGPAGAVAYRLASRMPRLLHETAEGSSALATADMLHGAMAWIPARVTALVYGLAGSLDAALRTWRRLMVETEFGWRTQTWVVLAEVSAASLGTEDRDGAAFVPATLEAMLAEVLGMQLRALLILLASFVLLTTGSLI